MEQEIKALRVLVARAGFILAQPESGGFELTIPTAPEFRWYCQNLDDIKEVLAGFPIAPKGTGIGVLH